MRHAEEAVTGHGREKDVCSGAMREGFSERRDLRLIWKDGEAGCANGSGSRRTLKEMG